MLHSESRAEACTTISVSQWPQLHEGSIPYFRKNGVLFVGHKHSLASLPTPVQKKSPVPTSRRSKLALPAFSKPSFDSETVHERKMRVARRPSSSFRSMNPRRDYRVSSTGHPVSDDEAASQVDKWLLWAPNRRHNQITGRILRDLINRRTRLEDCSLDNLLLAADETIFEGKLAGRVKWRWSDASEHQYDQDFLGTTALQAAHPSIGGHETLIVLSKPLLQDGPFSRDLLLSAFMHELVHCYLFLQCGLEHAKNDGHTAGFQKIAKLIDKWFGQQRLHLCNMRANLDHFRIRDKPQLPIDEGYVSRAASPGSPGSPTCYC